MKSPHDIDFSSTQVAAYNMALAAHPRSWPNASARTNKLSSFSATCHQKTLVSPTPAFHGLLYWIKLANSWRIHFCWSHILFSEIYSSYLLGHPSHFMFIDHIIHHIDIFLVNQHLCRVMAHGSNLDHFARLRLSIPYQLARLHVIDQKRTLTRMTSHLYGWSHEKYSVSSSHCTGIIPEPGRSRYWNPFQSPILQTKQTKYQLYPHVDGQNSHHTSKSWNPIKLLSCAHKNIPGIWLALVSCIHELAGMPGNRRAHHRSGQCCLAQAKGAGHVSKSSSKSMGNPRSPGYLNGWNNFMGGILSSFPVTKVLDGQSLISQDSHVGITMLDGRFAMNFPCFF